VFRLRRDTGGLDGVRTSKEIVYGIASMPAGLAPPAHLNHYSRRHWFVENRLRYVPGRRIPAQNRHRTPNCGHIP
jgi:hypothetical protein